MLLLMLFALIAGAGTAITPCVLPVVPALLASSATGGRRRPIGIVIGLALTFTVAIVLLAQLVKGIGLASGAARTLAIVVLIGFGVVLLIPDVAARVEAPLSRLARFGPKTRGNGFWSGLAVGGALGFVCAPCAGPILAAVTSVSASSGAIGARGGGGDLVLGWPVGGDARLRVRRARGDRPDPPGRPRLRDRARARRRAARDRRPDDLQRRRPLRGGAGQGRAACRRSWSIRPARSRTRARSRSASPRCGRRPGSSPRRRRRPAKPVPTAAEREVAIPGVKTPSLPDLGAAPEFAGHRGLVQHARRPSAELAGLRGHVVLIDFWTYTCINCLRTLPFLKGLYAHYHRYGLEIVGRRNARVHLRAGGGQRRAGDPLGRDHATRSCRTTGTAPGTPGRTSTGRPST